MPEQRGRLVYGIKAKQMLFFLFLLNPSEFWQMTDGASPMEKKYSNVFILYSKDALKSFG